MKTPLYALVRKYKLWQLNRRAVWAEQMVKQSLVDIREIHAIRQHFFKEAELLKKQIASF